MDYKALGVRIRAYRDQRGMTREALAQECGISVKHLAAIEDGAKFRSLETLVGISNTLGVSADDLLGRSLMGVESELTV